MWLLDLFSAVMFFGDNAFGAVLSGIEVIGEDTNGYCRFCRDHKGGRALIGEIMNTLSILIPFWLSLCDSFE